MTPEEREKILDVICTADGGGCSSCTNGLLEMLRATLPNEPWPERIERDEMYEREHRARAAGLASERHGEGEP